MRDVEATGDVAEKPYETLSSEISWGLGGGKQKGPDQGHAHWSDSQLVVGSEQ